MRGHLVEGRTDLLQIPVLGLCEREGVADVGVRAAAVWPICAFKLMDSAKPAGSSDGFTIFEPEERRASDSFNMFVDLLRLLALVSAAMFVLITITNSFLELPLDGEFFYCHGILAGGEFRIAGVTGFLLAFYGCQAPDVRGMTRHRFHRKVGGRT